MELVLSLGWALAILVLGTGFSVVLHHVFAYVPLPGWLEASLALGLGFWHAVALLGIALMRLTGQVESHGRSRSDFFRFWLGLEGIALGIGGSAVVLHLLLTRVRLSLFVHQSIVGIGTLCILYGVVWLLEMHAERTGARQSSAP